ncbi:hypothetical protein CY34DRAFT_94742, partial [Suillus luteus UH-Slu-Lm8-n1]
VNRFIQLADDSDEVPKLKGKSYADFRLSVQEWTELDLMHEVLQVHRRHGRVFYLPWYVLYLMPSNDIDHFGVALDPNYKVAYAKDKWAHCFFRNGDAIPQKSCKSLVITHC